MRLKSNGNLIILFQWNPLWVDMTSRGFYNLLFFDKNVNFIYNKLLDYLFKELLQYYVTFDFIDIVIKIFWELVKYWFMLS